MAHLMMHDLVHDLAQSIMVNKVPGVQVERQVSSTSSTKIRQSLESENFAIGSLLEASHPLKIRVGHSENYSNGDTVTNSSWSRRGVSVKRRCKRDSIHLTLLPLTFCFPNSSLFFSHFLY